MDEGTAADRPVEQLAQPTVSEPKISILNIFNVMLRHPRLLLGLPAAAFVFAYGIVVIRPVEYRASSTFMLHSAPSQSSAASGFAAQFGLSLPSGGGESMDFYGALLRSRALLERAAASTYRVEKAPGDTVVGTLADFYPEIEGGTPGERVAASARELDNGINVSTDLRTTLVTLTTTAPSRPLAIAVNRRLLELVNDFNLRRRQSLAAAERQFVEERMRQAQTQLSDAERDFENFLEQNRQYQSSPQLAFTAARLQRRVEQRQNVYASLAQAYENARIQEVRNTPLITVIDGPEGPTASTAGDPIRAGIFAAFLGLFLAVIAAFVYEYFKNVAPQDVVAYHEFRRRMLSFPLARLPRRLLGRLRSPPVRG